MFPIDVKASGVDVMTTGTYKWLLGSYGVAPFYVRAELLDRITPDRMGALHVERTLPDLPLRDLQDREEVRLRDARVRAGLSARRGAAVSRSRRRRPHRAAHGRSGAAAGRRPARAWVAVLTPAGNQSSIVAFRNPGRCRTHAHRARSGRARASACARTARKSASRLRSTTRPTTSAGFSTVVDELKARRDRARFASRHDSEARPDGRAPAPSEARALLAREGRQPSQSFASAPRSSLP